MNEQRCYGLVSEGLQGECMVGYMWRAPAPSGCCRGATGRQAMSDTGASGNKARRLIRLFLVAGVELGWSIWSPRIWVGWWGRLFASRLCFRGTSADACSVSENSRDGRLDVRRGAADWRRLDLAGERGR